jgi:hypothetical protein
MKVPPLRPTSGKDPEIKPWTSRRTFWRAHAAKYPPEQFNASGLGSARFSPLFNPLDGTPIPILYLANRRSGALCESVLHDCPTPPIGYTLDFGKLRDQELVLSPLKITVKIRLINLTVPGLKRLGLTRADVIDGGDYARTRDFAAWLYQHCPTAQGLRWVSRQDDEASVMVLFGDRLSKTALKVAGPSESTWAMPVEGELLDLATTLGITKILPAL